MGTVIAKAKQNGYNRLVLLDKNRTLMSRMIGTLLPAVTKDTC